MKKILFPTQATFTRFCADKMVHTIKNRDKNSIFFISYLYKV